MLKKLLLAFCVSCTALVQAFILQEEFLSPDRAHFDCHSSSIAEAAIVTADGLVHITYAASTGTEQRRIKHVVVDPAQLGN